MRIRKVADLAALAALVLHSDGDWTMVGSSLANYDYDPASEADHDGYSVVRPDNRLATQPGRWVRRSRFVGARLQLSEAQLIASESPDLVVFDMEEYKHGIGHDNVEDPHEIEILEDGIYDLEFTATWDAGQGTGRGFSFNKNSLSTIGDKWDAVVADQIQTTSVRAHAVKLEAGDVIVLTAYHDNPTAININGHDLLPGFSGVLTIVKLD